MQSETHKKEYVDGYELSYSSDWIHDLENWEHWFFYWNQVALIREYVERSQNIVEVGVGTGFLSNYLRRQGWTCITVDIDKDKKPDYVADVSSMDFSILNFDCLVAFEIFEHIPYPLFERAISNIARSKPRKIIFSVPWGIKGIFEFSIKIPKIKKLELSVSVNKKKISTPNHYWELRRSGKVDKAVVERGEKGFVPLSRMKEVFSTNGYILQIESQAKNIQFFVATLDE